MDIFHACTLLIGEVYAFKNTQSYARDYILHIYYTFQFVLTINEESFKYYSDVILTLRNESNRLWWDVYDDNKNETYAPPCKSQEFIYLIYQIVR